MGLRYRKSIKITKGIRININKNSTSVTIGRGRFKHTYNSNGKVSRSVSLPSTGLYYTETVKPANKSNKSNYRRTQKEYSPKMYKLASVSGIICGIIFIPVSLILLFIMPLLGFFGFAFVIVAFKQSKKFKAIAKELEQENSAISDTVED